MIWQDGFWIAVGVTLLGLWAGMALCQTTQGTYEDHRMVSQLQGPRPPLWRPRGLSMTTLWLQVRRLPGPVAHRLVQLSLAALVSLAVGVLAWRLDVTPWLAGAVMALHPLTVETIATMAGRAELIAALGIVVACVGVTLSPMAALILVPGGFLLGLLGKESAIVGLVLVPCVGLASRRRPRALWRGALCLGLCVVLSASWAYRHIGDTSLIADLSAWDWLRLQAGAAFRLLTLTILPVGQTVDYDHDALSPVYGWVSALSLAGLAGVAWTQRRTVAGVGLLWMLIVILPRLLVQTPKSYFNDHQFFMALVGWALIVASVHRRWVLA